MNWTAIVRDTLIVFALTFLGSLVAGVIGPQDPDGKLYALAATNIAFTAAGFTVAGVLARYDRWVHLLKVAGAVWLLSLVNVLLVGASLQQWAISLVFILAAMGIGGGISYLFAPRRHQHFA